jgi:hypothetical protein
MQERRGSTIRTVSAAHGSVPSFFGMDSFPELHLTQCPTPVWAETLGSPHRHTNPNLRVKGIWEISFLAFWLLSEGEKFERAV